MATRTTACRCSVDAGPRRRLLGLLVEQRVPGVARRRRRARPASATSSSTVVGVRDQTRGEQRDAGDGDGEREQPAPGERGQHARAPTDADGRAAGQREDQQPEATGRRRGPRRAARRRATAAAMAPATAAQASTSSGIAPVRPLSGPAAGAPWAGAGPRAASAAAGVCASGSSRKYSDRDATRRTVRPRRTSREPPGAAANQSMPEPSRLLIERDRRRSAAAATGSATKLRAQRQPAQRVHGGPAAGVPRRPPAAARAAARGRRCPWRRSRSARRRR